MRDVLTVCRKEWIEILDQFSRFRRGGWTAIIALVFLAVYLPLQIGPGWAMNAFVFFYWPFLTASMTSTIVADAIAGERERHTLETLLATRLGDGAILAGKLLASISYGYAFALSNLAVGTLAVRVAFGADAQAMSLQRFATLLVVIGAASSCISSIGVLVSLRATTVRQAQQLLGLAMLALVLIPTGVLKLLPDATQATLSARVTTLGPEAIALRVSLALLLVAIVFVSTAARRFRRGRLALD